MVLLNPLEYHASTSLLIQMLEKGHHGVRLALAIFVAFFGVRWKNRCCKSSPRLCGLSEQEPHDLGLIGLQGDGLEVFPERFLQYVDFIDSRDFRPRNDVLAGQGFGQACDFTQMQQHALAVTGGTCLHQKHAGYVAVDGGNHPGPFRTRCLCGRQDARDERDAGTPAEARGRRAARCPGVEVR